MSFDEVRFPIDISYGAQGGPRFRTTVVETAGGHEFRNAVWAAARAEWTIAYDALGQGELDTILAFWYARSGRLRAFRFFDWTDNAKAGQKIGDGDGQTTAFQCVKTYSSGGVTYTRTLTKLIHNETLAQGIGLLKLKFFLDAVEQTETTDWTVDVNTGIVTFVTAPGPAVWQASTAYSVGDKVSATAGALELKFRTVQAGTSDGTEPTWDQTIGQTTNDGTVVWETEGPVVVTADLFFDIPARFADDDLAAKIASFEARDFDSIRIIEVREK